MDHHHVVPASALKTLVNLKAEVEPTERQVSSVQDEFIRENPYVA